MFCRRSACVDPVPFNTMTSVLVKPYRALLPSMSTSRQGSSTPRMWNPPFRFWTGWIPLLVYQMIRSIFPFKHTQTISQTISQPANQSVNQPSIEKPTVPPIDFFECLMCRIHSNSFHWSGHRICHNTTLSRNAGHSPIPSIVLLLKVHTVLIAFLNP